MKKEENKYYTPNIEDFYIGYEFEFQGVPEGWHKMILSEENDSKTMKYHIETKMLRWNIENKSIRVSYLTKEQIENEGWINDTELSTIFYKGGYLLKLFTKNKIVILNPSESLFNGECLSINEFRTICKLLNIKHE